MANDVAKKAPARKTTSPAKKTAAKKAPARKAAPPAYGPPPGWYPSVGYPDVERYWDGAGWDDSRGSRPVGGGPTEDAPTTQQAAEGDGTGDGGGADSGTITFRGRTMKVRRPDDEQLALWSRIATRAQAFGRAARTSKPCGDCQGSGVRGDERCDRCAGTGDGDVAQVLRLYNQALSIVTSVLVDEADKDWLEDQLIEKTIDLVGASEIVSLTVTALITSRKPAAPKHGPAGGKARRRK